MELTFLSAHSIRRKSMNKETLLYLFRIPLILEDKRKDENSQVFASGEGNWFHSTSLFSDFSSLPLYFSFSLFHMKYMERTCITIRDLYWQFTLAPTDPATSRSLVLNSRGLQLHILCWSLRASRHLAAPSIASIWHSRSPVAAAEPIALSYCRNAFCKTSIFISPMLSFWQADRRTRCVN